jgi:hypothetical protein
MVLADLIEILENKLANLGQLKASAKNLGDLEKVIKLEESQAQTSNLLSQLKQIATTVSE